MYAVTATVERSLDGWNSTRQLPTFYLNENVQGIVNEAHAERIAKDIIDPHSTYLRVNIVVVKV